MRSGSFVVEGAGEFVVEAVGQESYAARIAGEARVFRHPRSPLERAFNRLLLTLVAVIAPLGIVLGVALWERRTPLDEAVPTSVAAVVTLVPEGLILLASLTFAVAALRMAGRGALVQQLNAVESLASVDVVCLDKTGTLTAPRLEVLRLIPARGVAESELESRVGQYAASAPIRNATVEALAERFPAPARTDVQNVPFSSRRRFGAVRGSEDWIVVGAPELFALGSLGAVAEQEAESGRRVVALGTSRNGVSAEHEPHDVAALGLAVIGERLRPEARATVDFFRRQGVELKILSGDRPATVAAVAADVGIPVGLPPVDGRELPDSSTRAGGAPPRSERDRANLARGEASRRRDAPRRRPLRRDDRRRRRRRSRAQGRAAGHRTGHRDADGEERGRRRARARRLRGGARDGGGGPEDPAQPAARHQSCS